MGVPVPRQCLGIGGVGLPPWGAAGEENDGVRFRDLFLISENFVVQGSCEAKRRYFGAFTEIWIDDLSETRCHASGFTLVLSSSRIPSSAVREMT